ncbi:hypothetical protein ZWY2020_014728 [Hordeum vulgare]|nr:hypothetical protein ZWY2020_014728 [Hordeum vulgare]
MVRVDQQDNDNDFVEPLPRQRADAPRKDGDEKCTRRSRASQEQLALVTKGFSDDQKKAANNVGMQSLMNVSCSNVVNPLCDWLGEIYDPASREFVIPGHERLPLDEESVFCTLGVPRGELIVPYETNNDIEQELLPHTFETYHATMPNKTLLATSLEKMKTHGDVSKMKLLMYLISSIFAPTTLLHPSNKCFPIMARIDDVKNMNWCKFIVDFLHDALSNNMYQKGCRLHLMIFLTSASPHKFFVSAGTYDVVKVVLAAHRITDTKNGKFQLMAKQATDYSVFGGPSNFTKWMDVPSAPSYTPETFQAPMEHLVGQFASGMTNLLGKLVEGLKSREFLAGNNNGKAPNVVNASKGGNASAIAIDAGVSPSKRGRTTEDLAQGPDGKKRRIDPVAARMRDVSVPNPSRASARLNKGVPTAVGISSTRPSPLHRCPISVMSVKKTVSCPTKATNKDPLERIHSKLATSDNVNIHVLPVNKPTATMPNAATSYDASKHSSVPAVEERHLMDFTPPSCNLGIDRSQDEPPIDPERVAFAFPAGMALKMVHPILDGRKAVKCAEPTVQVNYAWKL